VNAVLEEDDARDRRVIARREDEPAVVAEILARCALPRGLVRDHLRGAGLARHVLILDARPPTRAAGVDDHPEAVANRLQLLVIDGHLRLRRRRGIDTQPLPSS
jgi:hypothetical protein